VTNILVTAREIAAALGYLHTSDVLHGDLTGNNILLASSHKDKRAFTVKVWWLQLMFCNPHFSSRLQKALMYQRSAGKDMRENVGITSGCCRY